MNRKRAADGFTLVELLVAMTLMTLVMLSLMTALRSFGQIESRIDLQAQRDGDFRSSMSFMRQILQAMAPREVKTQAGAAKQIAFVGKAEEVNWIGDMPARHGAGGLSRFRLFVGSEGGVGALMLEQAPLTNLDSPLDSGPVDAHVLAAGVSSITLRYRESDKVDAQWLEEWPLTNKLPAFISVQINTVAGMWPELTIPVVPIAGNRAPDRAGGGSLGRTGVGPG